MGCFLACFGISPRRKRRRPANKVVAGDRVHGSYKPLDSSLTAIHGISDSPIAEVYEFRDEPKEQLRFKIRKKVSFNLNVQTYEPIPDDNNTLETDGEMKDNIEGKETSGSYPANHRYRNCRDTYDEEDEIAFEESDLDDEYEDDESDNSLDDEETSQRSNLIQPNKDESQYEHSVLKPIENLTQWKTAKAKAAAPNKQQEINRLDHQSMPFSSKTGLTPTVPFSLRLNQSPSKPIIQGISVDASLSNWLNKNSW